LRGPRRRVSKGESASKELLFRRDDYLDFIDLGRLPKKAGVPGHMLQHLIVKELSDNALDACDRAERPGAVEISVDADGNLIIADQGTGIDKTPQELATEVYCVARPMVSSKLLRKASRGAIGNGLRCCMGWITATQGALQVETGRYRVTLKPERDGKTHIVDIEDVDPLPGTRLTVIAGEQRFEQRHLAWALDAIELARRSDEPAFKRKPSVHWFDADTFLDLLMTADGNPNVREFLDRFDGCSGSAVRSEIAANFQRRGIKTITTREEAAALLAKAQALTTPLPAKALKPLGRDAIVCDGYALAEGCFTDGTHEPVAAIPFIVEAWVNAYDPKEGRPHFAGRFYMNRTKALTRYEGEPQAGWLALDVGNASVLHDVPEGPHYAIDIAISSPYFIALNDGKEPDCHPFADAIEQAVGKAANNKAARDIASLMTAHEKEVARIRARHERDREAEEQATQRIRDREEQQRVKAERERAIAERKAKPTIREAVMRLLPQAIEDAAEGGFYFNTRHLVYDIRERVRQLSGKPLLQSYFDALVTELEAERGEVLHPNLIREARGNLYLPHADEPIPLGTLNVRSFTRLPWTFAGLLVIEKDDLALMLKKSGFCEQHDCAVMSCKGFTTRAGRDLVDKIVDTGEPVRVFSVHDADAAGTLIHHTLQHATRARDARKIEVIDFGLHSWEGLALGLQVEAVEIEYTSKGKPKHRPVGEDVRRRADPAPTGETWEQWLQHSRVELNAMKPLEMRAWLDRHMAERAAGKVIPPDDILTERFGERVRPRAERAVTDRIEQQRLEQIEAIEGDLAGQVEAIDAEKTEATKDIQAEIDRITADLRQQLAAVSAPFNDRISEAKAEAQSATQAVEAEINEIDQEADIAALIEAMTPAPEVLKAKIGETFTGTPAAHWSTVLDQIADGTEVEGIDAGGAA
jgi:hypothetical protein